MTVQVVILAAGQGKRMFSDLPKVMHCLAGKPLLEHVIHTALSVSKTPPIIVYGHQGQLVHDALSHYHSKWVEQKEQLGTGHAIQHILSHLSDKDRVLILYGDVPLITQETLHELITATPQDAIGLLTAAVSQPAGYGRIKRNHQQNILSIIEDKDASSEERLINEINSGIYLVPASYLKKWVPLLKKNNSQGEYYLTDMIDLAAKEKVFIHALQVKQEEEIAGVNDRAQLAHLERFYQLKKANALLKQGVTLSDPARIDIRGEIKMGRDVSIDINVILEGQVAIGDGCVIGPNTILRNTVLGKHVEIKSHCVLDGAEVADHCIIGPFARLRPGTQLQQQVHIGNFVEIKNSEIDEKTKVNHLSYVGDSEVGKEVNIGAGVITCNYDGINKHKTTIGDRVQIGSDSTLVAPITLHDDVYVASATTVRHDVPEGALVYNKREECVKKGWTEEHRKNKR